MHPFALVLLVGCAATPAVVGADPEEVGDGGGKGDGATGLPDVHCTGAADAGAATGFRHTRNKLIAAVADPHHRGIDTIGVASADTQIVAGDTSYGELDKALEDEDVDLYACRARQWRYLGSARTDGEGHFEVKLAGADRLPLGMRDMFASVAGDRTGVAFVAYVADDGAPLAVSDVDGTLTSSESAFGATIVLGLDVKIHDGAPDAFTVLANRGYQPVYLTARSRAWTEVTRQWLADHGMPRGPLRLAPHTILPGGDTVAFKSGALAELAGFDVALGNGNRASDIDAYASAGLPADRIFVKLPEFTDELQPRLDAGEAAGYSEYAELQTIVEQFPAH